MDTAHNRSNEPWNLLNKKPKTRPNRFLQHICLTHRLLSADSAGCYPNITLNASLSHPGRYPATYHRSKKPWDFEHQASIAFHANAVPFTLDRAVVLSNT